MASLYETSLFLFHRDLRLDDNTGLLLALSQSKRIVAAFVLTPEQTKDNAYKGSHSLQFMSESLRDLDDQLRKLGGRLHLFSGTTESIISDLVAKGAIQAVYSNWDYTPYAHARDANLKQLCGTLNIGWHQTPDSLLHEPELVLKSDHKPYTVFGFFFKKAFLRIHKEGIREPRPCTATSWHTDHLPGEVDLAHLDTLVAQPTDLLAVRGGSTPALDIIAKLSRHTDYKRMRDFPALDATTHLSAHNKFGTVSIRRLYHAVANELGVSHAMITELHWREFFTHIGHHFPHVFGHAFDHRYEAIPWQYNESHWQAWCTGTTGFPIVDAGMRQLNATGYMHNRVRMIVASFLTKNLMIDWRKGEQYFATQLVDYDPAVNNGNWQWAASTGCDAQPYFRIFNPWLQGKRWDAEALYIKTWVPELASVPAIDIHRLHEKPHMRPSSYPEPIVDHATASATTKTIFRTHLRAQTS